MHDITDIKDRLMQIKEQFKLNDSSFSRICGISHVAMGHILKGRAKSFSIIILVKIMESLPVNPGWLLSGKGHMLLEKEETGLPEDDANDLYDNEHECDLPVIREAEAKYERLQGELIKNQKEYIKLLKLNMDLRIKVISLEKEIQLMKSGLSNG